MCLKIGDDGRVVLEIAQNDLEKFQECEDMNWDGATVDNEFCASFTLDDKQLYVTGLYPQEEQHGNDIIMCVECAGDLGREIYHYEPQGIKELLCPNGTEVIEATNISKHPLKLKEEKALQEKQDLGAAKEKAETDLQTKTQELENAEKEAGKDKNKALQTQLAEAEENKNKALETAKKEAEEKQQELQTKLNTADEELKAKENEIKSLKAKINQPNAEVEGLEKDLQAKDQEIVKLKKDKEITQLKQQQPDLDAKVLKMQLKARLEKAEEKVKQLQQENKELEAASQGAQNKTIKQPEQSNAAQYTADVGVGLAAGLIAFTALERTVRLDMLVMIGIAVASALVAGGITYAALPSTQVDGAKAQEVNENGKSK